MPPRTAGYVLVVDDNADIAETTAFLFETCGITAVTARDGREAYPSLVTVPVIIYSANADPRTRDRLPGVAAFPQKPTDPVELVAAVRRLLTG